MPVILVKKNDIVILLMPTKMTTKSPEEGANLRMKRI